MTDTKTFEELRSMGYSFEEARFWKAVGDENYDGMIEACGRDPDEVITKFVASDIAIATHSYFEDGEWAFEDAKNIFADTSRYDDACTGMGSWAEYVTEYAACILDDPASGTRRDS